MSPSEAWTHFEYGAVIFAGAAKVAQTVLDRTAHQQHGRGSGIALNRRIEGRQRLSRLAERRQGAPFAERAFDPAVVRCGGRTEVGQRAVVVLKHEMGLAARGVGGGV